MIKKNNKEKTIKEFKENKIETAFNIIPNISDKVLDYMQINYDITSLIENNFDSKRTYETDIDDKLILFSGIQSRMKQLFSITQLVLALTSKEIINKIGLNISYDPKDSLLKEQNVRAWLGLYSQEALLNLNKNYKDEGKKYIDPELVEFNNAFIKNYNKICAKLKETANINSNIHIYDCSILDVNYNNKFYEGSTTTVKSDKHLRGYKIGALRCVLPNGGFFEEICMDTASTHDIDMSRNFLEESTNLKKNDYLLMDRGFIDIGLFRALVKKEIKIIMPVRKNMELYKEAVNQVEMLSEKDWIKHPNSKRKGQKIFLAKDLELAWLDDNDKNKKPGKIDLDYKINGCVIRFEIDKNKDILSDNEIIKSDGKYAYAVIITNDDTLDCTDIIRMYEMRSEIEEDFRQTKDFWGLNTYTSTKYTNISFSIICTLLGYNFYQLYKESEEGKEYIGKSFIVQEKNNLFIVKGVRTAIVTEHYFAIFELDELLDLYADLTKDKRITLKEYLND